MAIFISVCCVCGKEYGRRQEPLPGVPEDKEVLSHGICSDECLIAQYGKAFIEQLKDKKGE